MGAYEVLLERGFIQQMTHETEIKELLSREKISFYIGFDPTADSLHVGHFLTVMAMSHMQRDGHRPLVLVGGGTGMIGDPTDRTDMRKMMTRDEVKHNVECFKKQLSRFIDFEDDKAVMVDNADWLMNLEYIPFLRDYGVHFSVNRMLTADSYRSRFERGLSFLEFNYMILQAYDFLELNRRYDAKMELGGNDQWSNIIAGVELIRRVESKDAYGMTFTLLTTSEGKKMGKTQGGAVWLDPEKTSPYDFYQYWRNVEDADVAKCLALLTYLPMEQVNELGALEGSAINQAKETLAYEVTKIVHGEEEAEKAQQAARALFAGGAAGGSVPTTEMAQADFAEGKNLIELMEAVGLIPSRGEGRRLIQQGGVSVGGVKIADVAHMVQLADFEDGAVMIQKGKKGFHKIVLV